MIKKIKAKKFSIFFKIQKIMKNTFIRFFLSSFVLLSSGCAYYKDVVPVRIDSKFLDSPVIKPSPSLYATHQIRGSVGVGYTPYIDPFAKVMGAIAGGVASGNANTGVALMAAGVGGPDEKKGAPSPFGSGVAIDIPKIYLNEITLKRGLIAEISQTPPAVGVVVQPSINLMSDKDGNVSLACMLNTERYVDGKKNWVFRYNFYNSYEWDKKSSEHIDASVFLSETIKCLKTLDRTFREHTSGDIDKSFKKALMMFSPDSGFRGMYYKDEIHQLYLRYMVDFIDINPVAKVYSLQYNE